MTEILEPQPSVLDSGVPVRRPAHRPRRPTPRPACSPCWATTPSTRCRRGRARGDPLDRGARPAGRGVRGRGAAELRALAARNTVARSMIGLGYYDTLTPAVIRRNVLENPAWYTAYTPYQPEISQGRLEALLDLPDHGRRPHRAARRRLEPARRGDRRGRGDDAGAALVEGRRRTTFVVDADTHPQTLAVLATRAEPLGIDLVVADLADGLPDGRRSSACCCQYPGTSGRCATIAPLVAAAHERGALVAVATDLLALTLLPPPGEIGADVVVGSAQRFGVPLGFGGPHAGFMSVRAGPRAPAARPPGRRERRRRRRPGLPARAADPRAAHPAREGDEQHLHRAGAARRDRRAVRRLPRPGRPARRSPSARTATPPCSRPGSRGVGVDVAHDDVLRHGPGRVPGQARAVVEAAPRRAGSTCGSSTPTRRGHQHRRDDHARATWSRCGRRSAEVLGVVARRRARVRRAGADDRSGCPRPRGVPRSSSPTRCSTTHRSETAMLRYLRRLSDQDIALDRAMIPLGSCTMKLNATTEMEPITWPEFAGIHPFAPLDQAAGYLELIRSSRPGWSRSPATTRSRCSRTRARRASSPGCSRSARYHRAPRRRRTATCA